MVKQWYLFLCRYRFPSGSCKGRRWNVVGDAHDDIPMRDDLMRVATTDFPKRSQYFGFQVVMVPVLSKSITPPFITSA